MYKITEFLGIKSFVKVVFMRAFDYTVFDGCLGGAITLEELYYYV